MKKIILMAAVALSAACSAPRPLNPADVEEATEQVTRVEPLSWWTGMKTDLQLMVQGPDIASYDVSIPGGGLKVTQIHKADSPNYLFVDVEVSAQAPADTYYLVFSKEGESFASLLRLVAHEVPEMRIRFTTSHPKDMSDETLRVIAEMPNVCKHIHLPVQSGSDRILKLMNRKYTREWYLDRVAAIRRIIPDCGLSTDIFVGYHSETEEDHQLSLSLMREVGYDSAFMFKYSERPGTYASKHLPDDVPEEEKIRRLNELIALQTEISAQQNKKDEGKEFDVLLESFSKRSREQLMGRTEQNKAVVVNKGNHHIGETVRVKITGSTSATLLGEIRER
jgi:MiaB/RimO family radical SAM methylthiotransferase